MTLPYIRLGKPVRISVERNHAVSFRCAAPAGVKLNVYEDLGHSEHYQPSDLFGSALAIWAAITCQAKYRS
jgi:hypothetical protein